MIKKPLNTLNSQNIPVINSIEHNKTNDFLNLPLDILRIVCNEFIKSPEDLHKLSLVCKKLNDDKIIWQVYVNSLGLKPLTDSYTIDTNLTENLTQKSLNFDTTAFKDYLPNKKSYFFYKKQFKIATSIINQMPDTYPYNKSKAQTKLAKVSPEALEFDAAKESIKNQTSPINKIRAQTEQIKASAQAKEFDKIKELTNQIKESINNTTDFSFKIRIQTKLARVLLQIKEFEEAKELINQIPELMNQITNPSDKPLAQIRLVNILAQAKEFDEAKKLINNQITHPFYKAKALIKLATALPNEKEFDEVIELLNQIKSNFDKITIQAKLQKALVQVKAKAKQFDKAEEIINQITNSFDKSLAQSKFLQTLFRS